MNLYVFTIDPLHKRIYCFCRLVTIANDAAIRRGQLEQHRRASYPNAMLTALRRVIALLILTAYVGAAVISHAPPGQAMSGDVGTGMAHHQEGPTDRMPCKSTPSPCVTDLGCIFLVGLPSMPDPTLLTLTAWSMVHYLGSPDALHGRSVKPAIGPPISRA